MNKPNVASKAKHRARPQVLAAAFMFIVAFGIGGGLWYLQRQADAGNYSIESRQTPAIIQARREAAIAKARMLREQWQGWALQHQDELKRLKNATTADQAALMAVWNAIPTHCSAENGGIVGKELSSGEIPFTWQPVVKGKAQPNNDPKLQEIEIKGQKFVADQLQKNFADYRDIALSQSMAPGTPSFTLWASGRITERRIIPNPNPGRGKPSFVEEPPKEIEPPYDFLR